MCLVSMLDPLKIFIGQLHPGIGRWELWAWLNIQGCSPAQLFMGRALSFLHGQGLRSAFAIYLTPELANAAVLRIHGLMDIAVTPMTVRAFKCYMGAYYHNYIDI